jgi:pumilio RNA-binding family
LKTAPRRLRNVKKDKHNFSAVIDQMRSGGANGAKAFGSIRGSVRELSFDQHGCRAVQVALELSDTYEQLDFVRELRGHFVSAVESPFANYVVQKVIEELPPMALGDFLEEFCGLGPDLASHRYGCRVMCRLLEHSLSNEVTKGLVDDVLHRAPELCMHVFGHHVIEAILEHGDDGLRSRVANSLIGCIGEVVKSRQGSYVIEKAMVFCGRKDKALIAEAVVSLPGGFVALAQDGFGCFVVMALLRQKSPRIQQQLELLWRACDQLRASQYGGRVVEKMELLVASRGYPEIAGGTM